MLESPKVTIITSEPDSIKVYLQKIWQYRGLIWVFAKRDLKVKYAQTWLGLGWIVVQPLLSLLIYTYFFGYVIKVQDFEFPFFLFVFSGLIFWNVFSQIFVATSSFLFSQKELLVRLSSPKILVAISKCLQIFLEQSILVFLFIVLSFFHDNISLLGILLLPVLLILTGVFGLFSGLLFASFSVFKRDFAFISPSLISFLVWLTPVFYPISILPKGIQEIAFLNPLTTIINTFRYTLGMTNDFSHFIWLGLLIILAFSMFSVLIFKKQEYDLIEKI